MVTKTVSIPETLQERLDAYTTATPKWSRFNQSAIFAEALDKKLKEEGY